MESGSNKILSKAEFNPLIKTYLFFYFLGILFISFIGIVVIPFWLLGAGIIVTRRYFSHLECILTERTLEYKKGSFFRIEKTILLDKIQDLTLKEGPLLRAFGLTALIIETAGQSNPQGSEDAKLIGIVNVREFRKSVIAQRDVLIEKLESKNPTGQKIENNNDHVNVLTDIKIILERIEKNLNK